MEQSVLDEFQSLTDSESIPDKFAQWASRIRKKKPEEQSDQEKEYIEAYNLRLSKSSTYFKNVTEYRTNKTEINENSVKIAAIDAEEKYFKRFADFAKESLEVGKKEYPNIIKKLHKLTDQLMKVIEGQGVYIDGLQTAALENEKARNENFKEVMKLKEKAAELQGALEKKDDEEDGITKMLEGENMDKLKGLLEMVKAVG